MDAAAEGARPPTAGSIAAMHAAARLYYEEDLSQHEVAERLNDRAPPFRGSFHDSSGPELIAQIPLYD